MKIWACLAAEPRPAPALPGSLPRWRSPVSASCWALSAAFVTASVHVRSARENLVEAKGLLKHGRWFAWLKETGVSPRITQGYIQLARLPAEKCATVAHLGMRAALAAAAKRRPQDALTAVVEEIERDCELFRELMTDDQAAEVTQLA